MTFAELELADAWNEYLLACRDAAPADYSALESWAWARLQSRLRLLAEQRPAAAA